MKLKLIKMGKNQIPIRGPGSDTEVGAWVKHALKKAGDACTSLSVDNNFNWPRFYNKYDVVVYHTLCFTDEIVADNPRSVGTHLVVSRSPKSHKIVEKFMEKKIICIWIQIDHAGKPVSEGGARVQPTLEGEVVSRISAYYKGLLRESLAFKLIQQQEGEEVGAGWTVGKIKFSSFEGDHSFRDFVVTMAHTEQGLQIELPLQVKGWSAGQHLTEILGRAKCNAVYGILLVKQATRSTSGQKIRDFLSRAVTAQLKNQRSAVQQVIISSSDFS